MHPRGAAETKTTVNQCMSATLRYSSASTPPRPNLQKFFFFLGTRSSSHRVRRRGGYSASSAVCLKSY